jgi:hypothetical protein
MKQNKNHYLKIGIRPIIDGRLRGLRELLKPNQKDTSSIKNI